MVESVVNPNHNPFTIPHDNDVFMLRDKERQKKKQVISCNYSWTCICSTVISTHLVVSSQLSKFQMFPLDQCNFHLYEAATTIKQLWSPLNELIPMACLYWLFHLEGSLGTESLQPIKLWITFQIKLNPCYSPEISINSDFEQVWFFFFTISGQLWHKMALFIAFFISGVLWNLNYSNQWLTLY